MHRMPTSRRALAAALALVAAPFALAGSPDPAPARAQTDLPLAPRIFLPFMLLGEVPDPPPASPTPAVSETPTANLTGTPTDEPAPTGTPEGPTATPRPRPTGPGAPACDGTEGDAGGFRFSLDGLDSLAPNAARLAPLAYTWSVSPDPTSPDRILELHENRVYRSEDAGCRFELLATLPDGGPWDALTRAPSQPDLIVASSVFDHRLLVSEDGGASWTLVEGLPDDAVRMAIAPTDPWDWAVAGRSGIHRRAGKDAKWSSLPPPFGENGIVSASPIPGRWGAWWIGSNFEGLFLVEDHGRDWQRTATEMYGPVGDPVENVLSVVGVWMTAAPSDPLRAYAAVNRVGRDQAERGLWRTVDGGRTWAPMAIDGQKVGPTITLTLTGGTRIFVSPHDADDVVVPFGTYFDGYGTDLFRSSDGLATLGVRHFDGFYEVMTMAWGPRDDGVVYVGVSSDIPPR